MYCYIYIYKIEVEKKRTASCDREIADLSRVRHGSASRFVSRALAHARRVLSAELCVSISVHWWNLFNLKR